MSTLFIEQSVFEKLNAQESWKMFLQLQNDNNSILQIKEELNAMKSKIADLEIANARQDADLISTKAELKQVKEDLQTVQRKQLRDNQYGRLENIEIGGIPSNVADDQLQSTVSNILKKIDVHTKKEDFHAVHRLGREKKNTIVRFVNRKKADLVFKNIEKVKDTDFSDISGGRDRKIYVNSNLTPEFKRLHYKLKLCKQASKIANYGSDRRGAFARTTVGGRKIRIELDSDISSELGITSEEMSSIEENFSRPRDPNRGAAGGFGGFDGEEER